MVICRSSWKETHWLKHCRWQCCRVHHRKSCALSAAPSSNKLSSTVAPLLRHICGHWIERLRFWRVGTRWRQLRQGEIRLLAGESLQERHDLVATFFAEVSIELHPDHRIHRLFQRLCLPIVKIGSRQLDVAQDRHLEAHAITRLPGDRHASLYWTQGF